MGEVKEYSSGSPESGQKKTLRNTETGKICEHMTYAAREAFKRLRTNVLISFSESEEKCQVIGVTSAQPSEGKSTISINLAYSLAELGKKVLLIDSDMRRPSLHEKMGFTQDSGLADLLLGEDDVRSMLVRYKSKTDETFFDVITAGKIVRNPSELLNSKRAEKLMKILETVYDFIILDCPPVGAVVDAINIVRLTDGMIIVIRENNCPRHILDDCVDQLTYAKANILGFVVNGSVEGAGKRYKYKNGSYRYSGYQSYRYGK